MAQFRLTLLDVFFRKHVSGKPGRSPAQAPNASQPSEYELNIDGQTERFLSSKQQLTYFLVTAAVVPVGFTLKLVSDKTEPIGSDLGWGLLAAGVGCGIAAAGLALLSIHYEHRSHRMHIASRYERKSFDDVSDELQAKWLGINSAARWLLTGSLLSLVAEMPLLAIFMALFVVD